MLLRNLTPITLYYHVIAITIGQRPSNLECPILTLSNDVNEARGVK